MATFSTCLVLGGARSGKSRFAEKLCADAAEQRIYIATGRAGDEEMRARIEAHKARRGAGWKTVEAPLDPAGALRAHDGEAQVFLVECLTLWLNNLMHEGRDIAAETGILLETLAQLGAPVVLVANEVGLGIVPDNKLAREFRDSAGLLNQAIAGQADQVILMTAGLPLVLKPGAA